MAQAATTAFVIGVTNAHGLWGHEIADARRAGDEDRALALEARLDELERRGGVVPLPAHLRAVLEPPGQEWFDHYERTKAVVGEVVQEPEPQGMLEQAFHDASGGHALAPCALCLGPSPEPVRIVALNGSESIGHCEACECPVDPYGRTLMKAGSPTQGVTVIRRDDIEGFDDE